MNNVITIVFIYFFTRIIFLSNYPHFYDSPEYLKLSESSFIQAVQASHESLHPVYLFCIQLTQKLAFLSPGVAVSLVSVIFGFVGLISLYYGVSVMFNKRIAMLSSYIFLVFPHIFLLQTQMMHEMVDQSVCAASLVLSMIYVKNRKASFWLLSVLLVALSIFNYIGMVIWLPLIPMLGMYLEKNVNARKTIGIRLCLLTLTGIILGLLSLFVLMSASNIDVYARLSHLLFKEGGQFTTFLNPIGIARILRNGLFVLTFGYSPFAILLYGYALYATCKTDRFLSYILLLWLSLFFIQNSFWHGGMYGRLGALIAYPLAVVIAIIPQKFIKAGILISLSIASLITIWQYQQQPVAEIQKEIFNQTKIESDDLLIISDYQRPQLADLSATAVSSTTYPTVTAEIEKNLKTSKKVYITHQAITFPYWQYDGQTVHIISKGDQKKAHLYSYLQDKHIELVTQNKKYPLLQIYEIKK